MALPKLLPGDPWAPLSLPREEELTQAKEDLRVQAVKEEEPSRLRGVGRVSRGRAAEAGEVAV